MDKAKILYVDDEQINITNFSLAFEEEYEVLPAYSGREALSVFNQHPDIAIVVADQRMPEMNGVELLTTIYRIAPEPIRIILTAYSEFDDIIEAVNKGHIYQYIQKPWDHDEVSRILTRALKQFRLIKENAFLLKEMESKNSQLQLANLKLEEELRLNERSEQKRREVEIKMMAQAKLASLGEIATGIAHEINQPLTFIQVILEATERDIRNDSLNLQELMEDLGECRTQIGRITKIINHLRTFGREDATSFCRIHLPEILQNALILFQKKIQINNISLHIENESDLPEIQGNANTLEQVFINLLQNSLDALQDIALPAITITFRHTGKTVQVLFKDNGAGAPEDICAKIFEPFFTTKETGKGTGLGLSIAYGIVKDHAGNIECTSAPNHGMEFCITFPAAAEAAKTAAP